MKPYDLKWRSPPPDPNPAAAKPRVKISRKGCGSCIAADRTEAVSTLDAELEAMIEEGDLEDELTVSIVMLSDEATEALPEFEGW